MEYNISIIAGLLSGLSTRLFGKRRAMPWAIAGIIIYTILVGASAAVVRAAIMGCLYVIATHYGRQTEALTSLMAAATLMTALNPQTLWDLGFQLSFAATLGLILYTPLLESWFERLLSRMLSPGTAKQAVEVLNEAFIITLAAQITTLPIIVYNFRQLSLVTLLSNFLILSVQPGVMLWGGLATIAGLIWLPLGQVLGWVAWLFLTYTIRAVEITASFPYASLNLGHVSPSLVCLYYGLLAGATLVGRQEPSRLKSLWRRLTARLALVPNSGRGARRSPTASPPKCSSLAWPSPPSSSGSQRPACPMGSSTSSSWTSERAMLSSSRPREVNRSSLTVDQAPRL